MIVLSGTSIGANDFIKYKKGKATLRSRTEYCQFIAKNNQPNREGTNTYQTLPENETLDSEKDLIAFSKIWNLKKTLAAYRAKRIPFTWLPKQLITEITKKQLQWTAELNEVQTNILAVEQKLQDRHPASVLEQHPNAYTQWQIENEWPLQLKLLNERKRFIENKIANLAEKKFTDSEILELITQSEEPIAESLIIESKFENGLFSEKVSFYPLWVHGTFKKSASETPWFEVKKSFLPKSSLQAIQQRTAPSSILKYKKVAALATNLAPSDDVTKMSFLGNQSLLFYGTPKSGFLSEDRETIFTSPNDLAIEGLLDLACLYHH